MESHHVSWVSQLEIGMFNRCAKLPEGKSTYYSPKVENHNRYLLVMDIIWWTLMDNTDESWIRKNYVIFTEIHIHVCDNVIL